jgi:hypothetical protein
MLPAREPSITKPDVKVEIPHALVPVIAVPDVEYPVVSTPPESPS